MRNSRSEIPIKIEKVNDKLTIKADKYEGNDEVRSCIHASLDFDINKTVIVIGLNPSVANADKSDCTFTKVGRYLAQYEVSDFYMFNLYETVSPNSKKIKESDITDWEKHRELFEKADFIVVAWGTELIHLAAKKKAIDFLGRYRRKVFCVQDSDGKKGKHPRRYHYDDELIYFFESPHYPVITLCGSTRFKDEFYEAQKRLTLEGYIVISVGLFGHTGDQEVWESMDEGTFTKTKEMLDDMHKRKIDMSDEIFVINVNNYIGESTKSEIEYAKKHGKKISYLEKTND